MFELVAPLERGWRDEERWAVRTADGDAVLAIFENRYDRTWTEDIARTTTPLIGFEHPRVTRIRAVTWLDDRRLAVISDNEHGPALRDAAAQLADEAVRERWAVAQVIALADALTALRAHVPALVHGRIEPGAVYVDRTGHARLRAPIAIAVGRPRGVVYLGSAGVTPAVHWMTPEYLVRDALTAATDVYALAALLAHTLTGTPLFVRDDPGETLTAILDEVAPPVPARAPGLTDVLAHALAKSPEARPPDPAALADALRACVPDWADHDACVSDAIAAWWPTAAPAEEPEPLLDEDGRCQKTWDELHPTAIPEIRNCDACEQPVVRVRSPAALVPLIGHGCVAYDDDDDDDEQD